METNLARIAENVEKHPKEPLQTLVHAINPETLAAKHRQMNGQKASGIDSVTKAQYQENLEENLQNLMERMKRQAYKPQPVKRVHIPKAGTNKKRPLGIPAYEDKLVQGVMADILSIIYEPKFEGHSYGFRPNRSCHDAIKSLNTLIEKKKVSYIVDADIKGFFDNLDHDWTMKFLAHDIADPNFLRLIKRFLKAGIMEEAKHIRSDIGAAQGGSISPVIANVYLHYVLDLWFNKVIKKTSRGESYMIRYADDFVCAFQYQDDAQRFLKALQERLQKFSLDIAEEKTKLIEFGRFAADSRAKRGQGKPETFDFLGFTHYCSKSQKGKFRVKRKTSRKKFQAKIQVMKQWLKDNMHTHHKELIRKLNVKLQGHYQYYGITDNYPGIQLFQRLATIILNKTLKRRTRRDGLTWTKYNRMLEYDPIIKPKIYVNVYST